VRVHFPDATILQASFSARQPLQAVQQLVRQVAVPRLAPGLYLYTTPPKAVLKDASATLHKLKLVPAAHLYVGCDASKLGGASSPGTAGPYLRPEAMALMQDTLPPELLPHLQQQQQSSNGHGHGGGGGGSSSGSAAAAAEAQRVMAAAAAASRSAAGGSGRGGGGDGEAAKKVPKWMQLGKK
jgi:hypothetical protein